MTTSLEIERLTISLAGAEGHEHRAEAIGRRAAALLARRLAEDLPSTLAARPQAGDLSVAPIELDLGRMADEAVAERVASALYTALASPAATAPGAGPSADSPA